MHARPGRHPIRRGILAAMLALPLLVPAAWPQVGNRVELRVDASAAEAVLAIVAARRAGQPVSDSAWHQLFASEPYRRLQQREAQLQRTFTEESFREFVLSDSLAERAPALERTLATWTARDLRPSARAVLGYLPADARIRATVYPMIKPQTNSFVFGLRGDPAIFLYLDPAQSPAQFENTVAHELHHIGFASVALPSDPGDSTLPTRVQTAVGWMGAFGEGLAMLAAAGGPGTHPHAASPAADRARWDRDLARFPEDLRRLEEFFLAVIDGRLATEAEVREQAFGFFGVQGPWYTVGYRMAVVIEEQFGRPALLAAMVDPRRLLARYNAAAAERNAAGPGLLPLWSPRLLEAIGTP